MEFISHAVKEISQLKKIYDDGYVRSTNNLIKKKGISKRNLYDYVGDYYIGYTKHIMCAPGFGYLHKGCPAAILFGLEIVNKKTRLYPVPLKYEFFLGIAEIIKNEQEKRIRDWKKIIKEEKGVVRRGFPPFEEYMNFFFNLDKKLCFENIHYKNAWGPSVYSESFIKIVIPKLKKLQIKKVLSKIKFIKGKKIKAYIKKLKDDKLPVEILLEPEIKLSRIYGFAVLEKYRHRVKFLEKIGKPIIWV